MKTDDISSSRENIAVSLVGTSSSSPGGSEDMKKSPVESGVSSATSHTSMPGNIRVLNINVGVLGHVDSGKTSLVKALSTSLSTAALDKNPQSQRRGITLDLGFSSFSMDIPPHLVSSLEENYDQLQFTLVDCPGHASLIRTIIGGAQIIDMIVLVVDINKGIQTQTAECIVIGEITTDAMIIVLNKVDLIPVEERQEKIEKMSRRIRKIFSLTKFHDPLIIATSAMIGGEKVAAVGATGNSGTAAAKTKKKEKQSGADGEVSNVVTSIGINDLLQAIRDNLVIPKRDFQGPFHFSIDHCFAIKGHGTVLTGTILSGMVTLNQNIELPELHLQRKVKSMQMFHKPVKIAKQGDRVGICVTNLDPSLIERGIATSIPTPMILTSHLICLVRKVRFFKHSCKSGALFHVSIGHQTVTAKVYFFGKEELAKRYGAHAETERGEGVTVVSGLHQTNFPNIEFDWQLDYEYQDELIAGAYQGEDNVSSSAMLSFDYQESHSPLQWMSLVLQTPVYCTLGSLIIASKLDSIESPITATSDNSQNGNANTSCRLAFYGPIKTIIPQNLQSEISKANKSMPNLRLYRWKQRECEIQRLIDCRVIQDSTNSPISVCYEAIGWKLYHKNATIKPFLGLKLMNESGEAIGIIHGPFGSSDKFRIKFPKGVPETLVPTGTKLFLKTKKYYFDKSKLFLQNGIEIEGADLRPDLQENRRDDDKVMEDLKTSPPDVIQEDDGQEMKESSEKANPVIHFPKNSATVMVPEVVLPSNQPAPTPQTDIPETPTPAIPVKESPSSSTLSASAPAYQPSTLNLTTIGVKKVTTKKSTPQKVPDPTSASPSSAPQQSVSTMVPCAASVETNFAKSLSTAAISIPSPPVLSNCDTGMVRIGTIETVKQVEGAIPMEYVAIVHGCFRMEENIRLCSGDRSWAVVHGGNFGELTAHLQGPFAKLGKCKVQFHLSGSSGGSDMKGLVGCKVEIHLREEHG